jgi:hypothetical protein
MLIALGIIAAVSGTLTYFLLNKKKPDVPMSPIHKNYTERPYDYKGVRPHDFIGHNYQGNRVMFYPYNYVNG